MRRAPSTGSTEGIVERELDNTAYDVVKIVSDAIVDVTLVATDILSVITTATNMTQILTVNGLAVEIASLFADKLTLDSLYADKITLDSLFTDKATLDSLFTDKATLDSLLADKAALDSLYADKLQIDTVYGSIANVNIVATAIANVNAVGGSIDNVNIVAGSITNTNIVAGSIANVNIVGAGIQDVNNYSSTYYFSLAVAPTIGSHPTLSTGDLYFDTALTQLRVYDGSVWTAAGSTVNGIDKTEQFIVGIPSGIYDGVSSTVFPLVDGYDSGFAVVTWNGYVIDDASVDISSGTSVSILSGTPIAGDIIKVIAYGAFILADHYTKTAQDTIDAAQDAAIALKADQATTYTKTEVDVIADTKIGASDYASADGLVGGTLKSRISGSTLYLTANGVDA